jgi:hypothetical protein
MQEEVFVKVLFRYFSQVLEQETVETMWAIEIDKEKGLYKLDSIPFYGPNIAPDDIFYAEYDQNEEMLTLREVKEYSGSSVIQVILMKEPYEALDLREQLSSLGCITESLNERYFVTEVPPTVNYEPVKFFLSKLSEEGRIEYAEPVLSSVHAL